MAVAFDANATARTSGNSLTQLDNGNLTIGAGSNMALVAQLGILGDTGAVSGLAMAWDPSGVNQALTQIATRSSSWQSTFLFGLVAPTTGHKILRAVWTGTGSVILNCLSFSGAGSFANTNSASNVNATPSLVINSSAGNMAVDCLHFGPGPSSVSPSKTQTFASVPFCSAGSRAAGAASVTFDWTLDVSAIWVQAGCSIVAASAVTVAQYMNTVAAETASGGIVGVNHWGT